MDLCASKTFTTTQVNYYFENNVPHIGELSTDKTYPYFQLQKIANVALSILVAVGLFAMAALTAPFGLKSAVAVVAGVYLLSEAYNVMTKDALLIYFSNSQTRFDSYKASQV